MQLQNQFNDRFCDFEKVSGKLKIFSNPFSCDIDDVPSNLQMNVIDLQSNDTLKNSFYEINDLVKFYGELKRFAQQLLMAALTYANKHFQSSITERINIVLVSQMSI
jgi:hypothetical protein